MKHRVVATWKLFLIPCFSLAALLSASGMAASKVPLTIEVSDGFALAGTIWRRPEPTGGVLLMHSCDSHRSSMEAFGAALHSRGLTVVSFDFRGLGESRNHDLDLSPSSQTSRSKQREAWNRAGEGFPLDAGAALDLLQGEVPEGSPIAVLGSSCGGREALRLASERPAVSLLVLISARLDSGSIATLRDVSKRMAVFATAAEGDRRAAEAARAIAGMRSKNLSLSRIFPGTAHATELIAERPGLIDEIADWIGERLAMASGEGEPARPGAEP